MPPNPLAHPFAHPFAPPLAATATATATQTAATTSTSNPTLPTLSAFLHSHFPTLSPQASAAEVPWLYHSPLPPRPNTQPPRPLPSKLPVEKLVLSITPTEGMYTALGAALPPPLIHNTGTPTTSSLATPLAPAHPPAPRPTRRGTAASFLHRPWTLTRARLPRGTTVFSSHKGFDEALTVGCNFALLERLGLDISPDAVEVLVGCKGDEGRRVGVVAGWQGGGVIGEREARARAEGEFGGLDGEGGWFGFSEDGGEEGVGVKAVACMNAFHPEEVERVANAALQRGYVADAAKCEGLVYLTGAVREEGLKAARERGMRVVCVGHRRCEVWGVGYLAGRVRERWPGLEVRVVDEEEVKVEKVAKKKGSGKGNGKGKGNEKNGKQEGNVGREHTRGQEEQKEEDMSKKRKVAEDESEDGGVAL